MRVEQTGTVAPPERLTDLLAVGVLAGSISRDLIDEVLVVTGKREQRRRLLPAHVMVYFALAMCLFMDDNYEEVMRKLSSTLRSVRSWRDSWQVPSTSGITQARARLGEEPMKELFERVAVPMAGRGAKGGWLGSRRLMAIDGSSFDVPDTEDNDEEFGRSFNGAAESAYPKAQVVTLLECGSRAVVGAVIGRYGAAERDLALDVLDNLESGMLVIADRHYYSFPLWGKALAAGADLLWRVNSLVSLPVLESYPDGSYRSIVTNPRLRGATRARLLARVRSGHVAPLEQCVPVRVVEYEIPDRDGNGDNELVCLVTSILDYTEAPAVELATTYRERWEIEITYGEVKTGMRGSSRVLRSQSPTMVKQEIWALLLAHYAIRKIMCAAAEEADVDPDRLSFIRSLRIVRRHASQADFPPSPPAGPDRRDP